MFRVKSIKKDLIITLSSSIAAVLIIIYLVGFFYCKHRAQETLDANLVKSAKLIFGLINHEVSDEKYLDFWKKIGPALQQKIFHRYEYKIHAQAWEGGHLVYNSDELFTIQNLDYEGFQDIKINGESWRSFSFYDPESNIKILVLESDLIKNELVFGILFFLLAPFLLSFSLLTLIVIIAVNKKLKPLGYLAAEIKKMTAQTLQQLQDPNLPIELKPFVSSFNSLIARLAEAIDGERNFTNYAAHELKTPLAAISVQAYILANNKNKEMEREFLRELLNGIGRATHLVNQLLTLSRVEPDNFNIKKEKFDLLKLTNSILKNHIQKSEEKNLAIEVNCNAEKSQLFINGNKTYIEILLGNLIENAIKYSPKDKKISILISKKNNSLSFKISNHGDQILPEEIEKLFNNFYRVSRLKATEDNAGCGLGLAIAKKIADLHGATISFESKNYINSVEVLFVL